MAYLSGNSGFVEVNGVRLDVTSWDAEELAEWAETTNTGDAGYKTSIVVKKSMSGTINANFDAALGPKGAPSIDAGDTIAVLELNTDASGTYTMVANVQRLRWAQPAGGAVTYTFDFESQGAYAYA